MKASAEFGWGAPKFKEQFPLLSEDIADHFDRDNEAMIRLFIRGYITPSQRDAAMKKIGRAIQKALRSK